MSSSTCGGPPACGVVDPERDPPPFVAGEREGADAAVVDAAAGDADGPPEAADLGCVRMDDCELESPRAPEPAPARRIPLALEPPVAKSTAPIASHVAVARAERRPLDPARNRNLNRRLN
jgi:hypothetical protein